MIIVICKTQFNLWISLQAMDKHFELMLYPNERHGVGFPKVDTRTKRVCSIFGTRIFLEKIL